MKKVRWGIIGCGDVTEKKSGPAFNQVEHSELQAVMRRDAAKAENYARRHGVPTWYNDAGQLIRDPEVDAVYIATPPDSHMQYAIRTAKAGKPVYVEKPMAINAAEAEQMLEVCRSEKVPLFVAYYRRALPRFLKVKELLESGAIGEIRSVNVLLHTPPAEADGGPNPPWRVNPVIAGGGYFLDMASHTLDLLDFLFGPIAEVHGIAVNQAQLYPAEDNVAAVFRFENGITGTGSWLFTSHEDIDLVEIRGSKGSIRFASFREAPVVLSVGKEQSEYQIPHPQHVQQPLIETVVQAILGKGECPSTGETALRTARVTDAILAGYYGR